MSKYSQFFPYEGELVTLPQGSVTEPSLTFVTDSDTGLYSSGAGTINFASDGTDMLLIDSSTGGIDIFGEARAIKFVAEPGSATAPAYTFVNDENTGIYQPTENSVGIAVEGNGYLVVRFEGTDPATYQSSVAIESQTSIKLPAGPTGTRPTTNVENGEMRYNTSTSEFEGYAGDRWISMGKEHIERMRTPLEPPDGTRTIFTVPDSHSYTPGTLQVFVNGLLEFNVTEVTSSTFSIPTPAVEDGDDIRVSYVVEY